MAKVKASRELIESANQLEISYGPMMYRGLSLADIAHTVHLRETGIIPALAAGDLLAALLKLHAIPGGEFPFRPENGDAYKNREKRVLELSPEAGGWLRTARARREASNTAFQITVREKLLELHVVLITAAEALSELAKKHINTIMPDYTYLLHAQPTTLAHYLLSFAFPITRDLERIQAVYGRVNRYSGGIGSINGSRLPLKRERLAELLGFEGVVVNTRDAMWQADVPIDISSALSAAVINLDRLGEDLQIWATHEFALIELDSAYCRESVIMPQKKNPYSLAYIRGAANMLTGMMASMAAVGRTVSGQPDSRIFAYGEIPEAVTLAIKSVKLITGVVQTLRVNKKLMSQRAAEGYSQATDLAEIIMSARGLPYLTAHKLVTELVELGLRKGIPAKKFTSAMIDSVAQKQLGRKLRIDAALLKNVLQPVNLVASRLGTGGAAPEQVKKMITEISSEIHAAKKWQERIAKKQHKAEQRLLRLAHAEQTSAEI